MTNMELITWIGFWLNLSEEDISDTTLDIIIEGIRSQYPDATDCQLKYYLAVRTLEYFIRLGSKPTTGSGSISKIREKVGKREKEVTYNAGNNGVATWDTLLDDLKSDPSMIGCEPFPDTGNSLGRVFIGGTGDRYSPVAPYRQSPWSTYNKRTS